MKSATYPSFTGEQASASAHPVVLVQMADGARLTLIEEHVGSNALSAPVLMADVGASASLHVAKYQDQAHSTSHLGLSVLKLGEQAKINGFTLSKGSKLARMESHVELWQKMQSWAVCDLSWRIRPAS